MRQYVRPTAPPRYHENLLLVGVAGAEDVRGPMRTRALLAPLFAPLADIVGEPQAAAIDEATSVATAPATATLDWMVRSGRVRRVVPLLPEDERPGPAARVEARTTRATVAGASRVADPVMAGSSLVEVQNGADLERLRADLAATPGVEFVSRVPIRYLALPARPAKRGAARTASRTASRTATRRAAGAPAASALWNLRKIGWHEARARRGFQDATGIRVAILDSGIDDAHPELRRHVKRNEWAHPDYPNASGAKDIIGHGTHVAGTIGAYINGDVGISGVCQCELHAWKIFDDRPDYDADARLYQYYVEPVMYVRALAACLTGGIDVMNLSIGGGGEPDPVERRLFDRLLARGVTVVAAMGNEREEGSPTSYPAAIPGVIAVGATGADDTVTTFSNRGSHISLCAPGAGIWSTLPTYPGNTGYRAEFGPNGSPRQGRPIARERSYAAWDGTSMATPHVTGAAALLRAKLGAVGPEEVRARLERAADRVPAMRRRGRDPDYGAGRLNLDKLLR